MTRYSREDYEHRSCLAVTRTESGEFVKCLVHTGTADEPYEQLGPTKSMYAQTETDHMTCIKCGEVLVTSLMCICTHDESLVRQFETGEAVIHPDDIEKGILND